MLGKKNIINLRILHISAHLGGGVGRAISNIVINEKKENPLTTHKIFLLEQPINFQYVDECIGCEINVHIMEEKLLKEEILKADVVIVHWWHHPKMAEFLVNKLREKIRLIVWFHVNGCTYPCIPSSFASQPHRTFFTTPYSLENPLWNDHDKQEILKKSSVVYGLGNLKFYTRAKHVKSRKYVVGYVGTLTNNKLHPDFLDYCQAVISVIPNVEFRMVGEINAEVIKITSEANKRGLSDHIKWVGYAKNIEDEFSKFDVFAYPLNPNHFGSTENVILEAMAFGLPVLMLNQPLERHILKNNTKIGFLVDSISEYMRCLKYLYDNPDKARKIGELGRRYVENEYRFEKNITVFRGELIQVIKQDKRAFNFQDTFGKSADEWLISCLGIFEDIFQKAVANSGVEKNNLDLLKQLPEILIGDKKSSINHFGEVFPNNLNIKKWIRRIHG